MKRLDTLQKLRNTLPQRVVVRVENTDDGLWAKISTPDNALSNCYTQAANATELVAMINEALFTHYEIPKKYRTDIGFYVPLSKTHLNIEGMINRLVSMEKELDARGKKQETLMLQTAVC